MISNEELYDFWKFAKRWNPHLTLPQAARLVRQLLAEKRKTERRGPTQ